MGHAAYCSPTTTHSCTESFSSLRLTQVMTFTVRTLNGICGVLTIPTLLAGVQKHMRWTGSPSMASPYQNLHMDPFCKFLLTVTKDQSMVIEELLQATQNRWFALQATFRCLTTCAVYQLDRLIATMQRFRLRPRPLPLQR